MNDLVLNHEHELIAQAMLQTRGDLVKASRFDTILHNAMSLRREVLENPDIRKRYYQLLAEELSLSGLHIAERILKMTDLQEVAYGNPEEGIPCDPSAIVMISKEMSRLIAEGKQQNISANSAVVITSKENAQEILRDFLDS